MMLPRGMEGRPQKTGVCSEAAGMIPDHTGFGTATVGVKGPMSPHRVANHAMGLVYSRYIYNLLKNRLELLITTGS